MWQKAGMWKATEWSETPNVQRGTSVKELEPERDPGDENRGKLETWTEGHGPREGAVG